MRTRLLTTLALAVSVLSATPALAQTSVQFPVIRFRPIAVPLNPYLQTGEEDGTPTYFRGANYFHTEGAMTLPHLTPSAHVLLHYERLPLELVRTMGGVSDRAVINHRLNADVGLAFGLWNRLEVALVLPITFWQDDSNLGVLTGSNDGIAAGLGDLRFVIKGRALSYKAFSVGVSLPISVPTGKVDDFLGSDGVSLSPRINLSLDAERWGAAINVGYRWRSKDLSSAISQSQVQQNISFKDEFYASAGARFGVWKQKIDLVGDVFFAMGIDEQDKEERALEALGGARFYLPLGFIAHLGAGPGLTRGVGTPAFRILAGFAWQRTPKPEPKKPEPKDSDGDGLLDEVDKCPNEAEDKDGYQDIDGCADPDNDSDGIPDKGDKCPNKPEDKDGFEDQDGCPDPDNDKDGIADKADQCPNKPEDKDGFEDENGCPDPDNDKDNIPDAKDQCPNKPETVNGVEDGDGCPDKGKGPVQIKHGKITVPPVYFATAKDRILRRSFPTLRMVAKLLKDNGWVKKVRVEGHTDSRGRAAYNLDLSKRRAASVMKFLIDQGVEESRLISEGFGKTKPIASNRTRRGRAKNRRVDFVIIDPPQSADGSTETP